MKYIKADADTMRAYIADRIVRDPDSVITVKDLRLDFIRWNKLPGNVEFRVRSIDDRFFEMGVARVTRFIDLIEPLVSPGMITWYDEFQTVWVGVRFAHEPADRLAERKRLVKAGRLRRHVIKGGDLL